MHVWRMKAAGEPGKNLELVDEPEPMPGRGEVAIRGAANGLCFPDVLQCRGGYQEATPPGFVPGRETAGVIDAVGDGVDGLRVGDRVVAVGGGLAEIVVQPAHRVFGLPDAVPFLKAAALPVNYLTTWYALHDRAALRPGEWLLVAGASGGAGTAAIQLGLAAGARVLAVTGGADRVELCRRIGAHAVIDYDETPEWVNLAREVTDGGADVAFDPVGGDTFHQIRRAMGFDGRLLVVGFVAGIPQVPANHVLLKNYSVIGVHWGPAVERRPELLSAQMTSVLALVTDGVLDPPVFEPYPFAQAPQALEDLAARRTQGKVVVQM